MEFLHRNFDSTNPDPDRDRQGCRKRGMVDAEMPDGHQWGREERPPKFIVIRCPEIVNKNELPGGGAGMRKVWRDDLAYEILPTSQPANGLYDVRVYELNPGAINQNVISGIKATRARDYLQGWGCSNFSLTATDASFTFSLWDAVRSPNFWNVTALQIGSITFILNSFNGTTGIGNITATVTPETEPLEIIKHTNQITRKIEEKGGTVISVNYPEFVFEIERNTLLTKFRADVKRNVEQVYMYQQHRLNDATMDAAVAAGGFLTLTKAQYLVAIRDLATEV